jgi:hypothetical protein
MSVLDDLAFAALVVFIAVLLAYLLLWMETWR